MYFFIFILCLNTIASMINTNPFFDFTDFQVSLNTYDFQQLASGVSSPWQLASGCNDKSFLDSALPDPRTCLMVPCWLCSLDHFQYHAVKICVLTGWF